MNKEKLIKKWLDGELNTDERQEFEKLEEYDAFTKIASNAKFFKAPDYNSSEAYKNLMVSISKRKARRSLVRKLRPVLQMAAILILGIAIFKLFFDSEITTVNSLAGQTISIDLPDASIVQLNAISQLRYSGEDWQKDRRVQLEGEAFFKVAEGSQFDVETDFGIVRVVGTEFNVKSREHMFEVTCFEGQVHVLFNDEKIILPPGKSVRLMAGKISQDITKLSGPSWTDGMSSFKSVPLVEVIAELERQYGILVASEIETDEVFTGAFVNNNLKEALASVAIPFGLKYKITNERVTFTKLD